MRNQDEGSAGVLIAAVCTLILIGALAGVSVAQLIAARANVQSAADMAALSGASPGVDGCATAHSIARANDVELVDCHMAGDLTVTVTDTVDVLGRQFVIDAMARAGPPD